MKSLGVKTFIYPQPVLILGTFDENGKPNAMNAAWGGIYDYDKVYVSLSNHKTTDNFKVNKCFTLGIGDVKNVVACDYVGIVSGKKEPDKVQKAGWTYTKSEKINAPIFNELPITIECEIDSFKDGILIGKILDVLAQDEIIGSDGLPSLDKFTPISYDPVHHNYLELGKIVGKAFSDGKKIN